jgi:hypothetical protein
MTAPKMSANVEEGVLKDLGGLLSDSIKIAARKRVY